MFKQVLRQNSAKFLFIKQISQFSTLALGEHMRGDLKKGVFNLLSAANELDQDIDLLLIGGKGDKLQEMSKNYSKEMKSKNVRKILVLEDDAFENNLPDNISNVVQQLIENNNYDNVIGLASLYGKNIIPNVAAKNMQMAVTDVMEINSPTNFTRPVYGANAFQNVDYTEDLKFLTVRESNFDSKPEVRDVKTEVENLNPKDFDTKSQIKFIREQEPDKDHVELTSAQYVVGGGISFGSAENFDILKDLSECFKGKAALGATRAAVDAGYVPVDWQIGQTGKIIAPDLYIAIGISGAIQHIAGIQDSKVIVSINKDEEAPIFGLSDYVLVGDLFKLVPELTEKLNQLSQ